MPTPSVQIIQLLNVFAEATTAPVFGRMLTLIYGAILAPSRRTVASCLRAVGLEAAEDFGCYHRVFSRAKWSPFRMSHLLFMLILCAFVPEGAMVALLIDDTLERRSGKRIRYKGWFYDAARSAGGKAVSSLGIRWLCVSVLVMTPWSSRPWALPFLLVPVLSEKRAKKLKRPHRSCNEWTKALLLLVRRWCPDRKVVAVADGAFACTKLAHACQKEPQPIVFVSRLRQDAVLHAPAPAVPKSKRGPKPKKGERLPSLAQRLNDPETLWRKVCVSWYQKGSVPVEMATDTALWCRNAAAPVPIRWVLLRFPDAQMKATALFCSDPDADPEQILLWYMLRWNIEVTFEEIRACLGFGTQRHWSTKAVGRTTPCLFGLFSLVALMAKTLYPEKLPIQQSRWYEKEEATFRDALAAVRQHLWGASNYQRSPAHPGMVLFPIALLRSMQRAVCQAS